MPLQSGFVDFEHPLKTLGFKGAELDAGDHLM